VSVGKGIGPKETREMGANKRKEEVGKRVKYAGWVDREGRREEKELTREPCTKRQRA